MSRARTSLPGAVAVVIGVAVLAHWAGLAAAQPRPPVNPLDPPPPSGAAPANPLDPPSPPPAADNPLDPPPAAPGPGQQQPPQQQPARPLTFTKVSVRDPMVNDIVGATLLVPEGWRVEGGFQWMPLTSMQATLLLRVSDPATGASSETLPAGQFVWAAPNIGVQLRPGGNWLGSTMFPPPRGPAEFVQEVLMPGPLARLRGARLVGVQDLPKVAAEFARANNAAAGGLTVRSARLRYAYADPQDRRRAWEEDVWVTLTFGQPKGGVTFWYSGAYATRAPAGELDRLTPVLTVPASSTRVTLEWSGMLDLCRQMFQANVRGQIADTARLGELYRQHREEIAQKHRQVYEERQAAQDRQNFARREVLGGVETYKDPYGARPVELPAGYRDYWVNDKGQYVLSADPAFDPRQGSTHEWRRMERAGPRD
ncbi:MAG TPA: hypothetical protein VEA69_22335 [Tepidisphaeraceae bacterium]|nr:hypothetical protein [Tepidisphaeraceae bacterium]